MTSTPTGADLARIALAAAKAAAIARGQAASKPKPRRLTSTRRGGRDPLSLGAALGAVVAERGWDLNSKAGTITDRWPAIAPPDLAAAVRPEHYDAQHRTLHLRPSTNAAATALRWRAPQLPAQLNAALGDDLVHTIKVLAVGSGRNQHSDAPSAGPEFSAENRPRPVQQSASPTRQPSAQQILAKSAALAAREQSRAQEAARLDAVRSPHIRHCPTIREPEGKFVEAVRAREEADEQARRSAVLERRRPSETTPPRVSGAA